MYNIDKMREKISYIAKLSRMWQSFNDSSFMMYLSDYDDDNEQFLRRDELFCHTAEECKNKILDYMFWLIMDEISKLYRNLT